MVFCRRCYTQLHRGELCIHVLDEGGNEMENWEKWEEEESENLKEIERLREMGHTYHCACRQVWGDGECECRRVR